MTTLQLVWLAIVQGLTEFLPVSSSGHLILFSAFTDFPDQGIGVDIALHIGSLAAVVLYFYKTFGQMICGVFKRGLLPDFSDGGNKLAYLIVIASLPALLVGFLLRNYGMNWARTPALIGWTVLLYGLLLWYADKKGKTNREINDLQIKDVIFIGLAQCLALVPGTSRSGITITMARFLGINRSDAAKFSMLLSVPTILAAGSLEGYSLFKQGNTAEIMLASDAALFSFFASFAVIFVMLKWLKKSTYMPFVIYRVILGSALILYSYNLF